MKGSTILRDFEAGYAEDSLRGLGAITLDGVRENYPTLSQQMARQIYLYCNGQQLDQGFIAVNYQPSCIELLTTGASPAAAVVATTKFFERAKTPFLCDLDNGQVPSEEPAIIDGMGFELEGFTPDYVNKTLTEIPDFNSSTTPATALLVHNAKANLFKIGTVKAQFNGRSLLAEERLCYFQPGVGNMAYHTNTPASAGAFVGNVTNGFPGGESFRHRFRERLILVNGKKFEASVSFPLPLLTVGTPMAGRLILHGVKIIKGDRY